MFQKGFCKNQITCELGQKSVGCCLGKECGKIRSRWKEIESQQFKLSEEKVQRTGQEMLSMLDHGDKMIICQTAYQVGGKKQEVLWPRSWRLWGVLPGQVTLWGDPLLWPFSWPISFKQHLHSLCCILLIVASSRSEDFLGIYLSSYWSFFSSSLNVNFMWVTTYLQPGNSAWYTVVLCTVK